EASGQHFQNLALAELPKLYPPLLMIQQGPLKLLFSRSKRLLQLSPLRRGPPSRTESQNCTAYSQVSAASWHRQKPPGIQLKGMLPFEHLEVDFTEMRPHRHYHYLLVML
ncbi:hypothetical protein CapIbe_023108, partial [Capra ibex]